MRRQHLLLTLLCIVALAWSTAALAQALDPSIPTSILTTGQGISWPVALVAVAWMLARELRYAVDACARESDAWRARKAGSVRIVAEVCDKRRDDTEERRVA